MACIFGIAWGDHVNAQTLPNATGNLFNQDPSVLQNLNRDLQKEEMQTKPLETTPEKTQSPSIDTETDKEGKESTDDSAEEVKFTLQELQVKGVTVIESKELEEKFSPWIGKDVGYTDLLKIAGEITELYKSKGFITTRAILPPQEIENGIVLIQVVEGRIGQIEIKGNKWVREGYINAQIKQNEGTVFKLQALEKDVIELNSNTLFDKVHATLKPGQEPGTSDIDIEIKDHFPLHLQLSTDNQGRNSVGLYRAGATVTHENLLGFGDNAAANVELAENSVSTFEQYKFPLNNNGWNIGVNHVYSFVDLGLTPFGIQLRPDSVAKRRKITGETTRFSIFTEFPIYSSIDTNRWNINGDISLNFTDTKIFVDSIYLKDLTNRPSTSIRSIISGVNITEQDKTGRWILRGAMTNAFAEMGGNTPFTKFNADATRIQNLGHGLIGLLRVQSQMTPDRLPGLEQFQIGGANSVRGISEGYFLGDSGYLVSGEIRFPFYGMPKYLKENWQGLVFFDHAGVFITGPDHHPKATGNPGFLTGYGFGFRGKLSKYLNARVDLGWSLNDYRDQPDLRAHFSLSSQLF